MKAVFLRISLINSCLCQKSICFPSEELSDAETARAQFYLAIRSTIYKQTEGDPPDAEIMNRVVKDMVRGAITCTGILAFSDSFSCKAAAQPI